MKHGGKRNKLPDTINRLIFLHFDLVHMYNDTFLFQFFESLVNKRCDDTILNKI